MRLLILLITALYSLATASDTHWGYPDVDSDQDFPKWGGICDRGKQQSPVNLKLKSALKGLYAELTFTNYDAKQTGVSIINNGHTVQLSAFPFKMYLEGGPLRNQYIVEQCHLHWNSEHTIDGIRYPMELHIVHRNTIYPNMSMAANFKDGIAVLSVLYHASNEKNDMIAKVVENLDTIENVTQINRNAAMKETFTMREFFPQIENYLTYFGSLTTPSCAESVTWMVFTKSFPVTIEQVDKFKAIQTEDGKQLKNNYRYLQDMNGRTVVIVEAREAASTLHLSLGTMLLMAILHKLLH